VGRNEETGESFRCNIQFYMAIEGLCGWHSNHNADVPWVQAVSCADVYSSDMNLTAVRMAALTGVVLNAVGTEMKLPFGGYGLTGVCNDTAALVDQALRGTTEIYPLTSTGRFLMHVRRRMQRLHDQLLAEQAMDMSAETRDLEKLAQATKDIPSDLHASPGDAADSARRMRRCLPPNELPFQLMVESKNMMETIVEDVRNQ